MTKENYNYRTSQALLRNQFPGKGKLQIPIIPRFDELPQIVRTAQKAPYVGNIQF